MSYESRAPVYNQQEKREIASLEEVSDDDGVNLPSKSISSVSAQSNLSRIILYNAQLSLIVDTVKMAKERALAIMKTHQGYMISSSNNSLSMRVPASGLNNVLASFKGLGKVNYENVNGVDVTDHYYDIKIRLENAEKTRNRYLELLNQAKNVTEILQVEKELARLNGMIDSYKGKIKRYDQESKYSLITIHFYTKKSKEKKVRPGPLGYIFVGLYKGIKWLFVWD